MKTIIVYKNNVKNSLKLRSSIIFLCRSTLDIQAKDKDLGETLGLMLISRYLQQNLNNLQTTMDQNMKPSENER